MREFIRDDDSRLRVVGGFRQFLLDYRQPTTPRATWTEAEYAAAATKKRSRAERLLESFRHWSVPLDGVALLDVACGDGSNVLVLGEQPARILVGIDLELPLFTPNGRGEQARRLAATMGQASGALPPGTTQFARMNATSLGFATGTFDVLMSRSATEHIRPIEPALQEMVRVVKGGGLIHLSIDPYYWVRGCHKRGIVDIPWAHARLTLSEYDRFVATHEGERVAARRYKRLDTLNRFTVAEWRQVIDQMGCEVLEWRQSYSTLGDQVLARYPDVLATLLPGVTREDLLCERIKVWLRNRPRANVTPRAPTCAPAPRARS